ncbi:per1-like family protein, partial [Striga asiatica]
VILAEEVAASKLTLFDITKQICDAAQARGEQGCVGNKFFQHCNFSSGGTPVDGPWYLQDPLNVQWKQRDCCGDCHERQKHGYRPVEYHGKWPFMRIYGIQEPVSVAFSALNLAVHFHGWGRDGSILLDSNSAFTGEKNAFPNLNSARGYEVIDSIKANVKKAAR